MKTQLVWRPICLMTIVLLMGTLVGCGKYGRTSAAGYKYAAALYSVCNLEDARRLGQLQEMVAVDREAGEITPQEARWIEGVMDHAADGDWETAKQKSRKLMEDQLGRE